MIFTPAVADWIGRVSLALIIIVSVLEFALTKRFRHVILSSFTRPLEHIKWKPISLLVYYIHGRNNQP
jgi:hypothetical protein